jgi:hypothetical protein
VRESNMKIEEKISLLVSYYWDTVSVSDERSWPVLADYAADDLLAKLGERGLNFSKSESMQKMKMSDGRSIDMYLDENLASPRPSKIVSYDLKLEGMDLKVRLTDYDSRAERRDQRNVPIRDFRMGPSQGNDDAGIIGTITANGVDPMTVKQVKDAVEALYDEKATEISKKSLGRSYNL